MLPSNEISRPSLSYIFILLKIKLVVPEECLVSAVLGVEEEDRPSAAGTDKRLKGNALQDWLQSY